MDAMGQWFMDTTQKLGDATIAALDFLCEKLVGGIKALGEKAGGMMKHFDPKSMLPSLSKPSPPSPAATPVKAKSDPSPSQSPTISKLVSMPSPVKEAVAGLRQNGSLNLGDVKLGLSYEGGITGTDGVSPNCQHYSTARRQAKVGMSH